MVGGKRRRRVMGDLMRKWMELPIIEGIVEVLMGVL
jgi:hypothetical protein